MCGLASVEVAQPNPAPQALSPHPQSLTHYLATHSQFPRWTLTGKPSVVPTSARRGKLGPWGLSPSSPGEDGGRVT
eukprot:9372636-Lingulodinium_polyedra.AAC.1